MAADPPTIVAVMSKLTGNVDPAEIFKYAPGELKNLPGYESAGDGGDAKLGGFDAYQIGATYVKDGAKQTDRAEDGRHSGRRRQRDLRPAAQRQRHRGPDRTR